MSVFCIVDDKYVPLYRVMWVSVTPHFCGDEQCLREGFYEIRLEQGESVWAKPDSTMPAFTELKLAIDPSEARVDTISPAGPQASAASQRPTPGGWLNSSARRWPSGK